MTNNDDGLKRLQAEDAEDLAAFEERAQEEDLAFEEVLQDLKLQEKL